jgi:ribA/ribD-fused uncharacterized protein
VAINRFTGEYGFLSNFYHAAVRLDGVTYFSVEHAFQAAKTNNASERNRIRNASTPGAAKKLGRKVKLRPDWESVKINIMRDLLQQKFAVDPLKSRLLATNNEELTEGNTWNDQFWGVCDGEGENWLGVILMSIREDLVRSSVRL